MTESFKKFICLLKKYDAYGNYIRAVHDQENPHEKINRLMSAKADTSSLLNISFVWAETRDGQEFWHSIYDKLLMEDGFGGIR